MMRLPEHEFWPSGLSVGLIQPSTGRYVMVRDTDHLRPAEARPIREVTDHPDPAPSIRAFFQEEFARKLPAWLRFEAGREN